LSRGREPTARSLPSRARLTGNWQRSGCGWFRSTAAVPDGIMEVALPGLLSAVKPDGAQGQQLREQAVEQRSVIPPLADAAATTGTGLASMGSRYLAAMSAGGVWATARSPPEVTLCPVRPPFWRSSHQRCRARNWRRCPTWLATPAIPTACMPMGARRRPTPGDGGRGCPPSPDGHQRVAAATRAAAALHCQECLSTAGRHQRIPKSARQARVI